MITQRIFSKFKNLSLKYKFTLCILIFTAIPIVLLSNYLFTSMERNIVENKKNDIQFNINQSYNQLQKNIELCNLTAQIFINNKNLNAYIDKVTSGESISIEEKIEFYRNDIMNFEKIVNNNPYLYGVRVYVESDTMQEMVPVLFQKDRMRKLTWAENNDFVYGEWQLDYIDNIFSDTYSIIPDHIASLVINMSAVEIKESALVEVAIKMSTLFPDIYQTDEEGWTCFIDAKGNIYSNEQVVKDWSIYLDYLEDNVLIPDEQNVTIKKRERETVIIASIPVKELAGTLVRVYSMDRDLQGLQKSKYIFTAGIIAGMILLGVLVNFSVKLLLDNFYKVMKTVHDVQQGDMDVRVGLVSSDEMGELATQFDKMLDIINQLMKENIRSEVLKKDFELRALQNQIDSHFLFNVLETIKMMAEIREEYTISDALTSLGKLLRYGIHITSQKVDVQEEIAYIQNYMVLINYRYEYDIFLSINLPTDILQQKIPKMTLQPIVENAIIHGIEELAEDTNIYIKGILYDDYVEIEITDQGIGMHQREVEILRKKISGEIESTGKTNGIGLKNVQDRLQAVFGENYGIEIVSRKDCFTKVIVRIPRILKLTDNKGERGK